MGDGQQERLPGDAGAGMREELAAVSARVAALEGQIANLHSLLARGAAALPKTGLRRFSSGMAADSLAAAEVGGSAGPSLGARPAGGGSAPGPASFGAAAAPVRGQSLEKRLGSQVFSRVGIIVVLIGAALFLKLAIDNQWIGPTGRVLAGLFAGVGLVVWSEWFRRKGHGAFSYTLKAVGSGVLYLSLWAAFQTYHLLPAGVAFTAMVLVTAWNAYMAWVQRAEGLAAYALIGGFATPLLLSTGGNHEIFLFGYVSAIDVATIALVRLRGWPRLLLAVFPATVGFFIGWYAQYFHAEELGVTSLLIAAFFVAFASVPLRGARLAGDSGAEVPGMALPVEPLPVERDATPRQRRGSVIAEVLLPLANAGFGSLAFYSVLQDSGLHSWLAWMVVVFAAIYLGLMRLRQSAAAAAVHLSLAIVFLTIAIPLKASGHWITVSWLVEGTALLWVAARLAGAGPAEDDSPVEAFRVLRTLALGALLLGLGGVLTRTYWDGYERMPAFWNHRFATATVGVAAFSLVVWISLRARRQGAERAGANGAKGGLEHERHRPEHERQLPKHEQPRWLQIAATAILAINTVTILAVVREIRALWPVGAANVEGELQQALAVSAFLMVYGGGLLAVGFWKRTAFVRWQALLLIVFTIGKTFLYDMRSLSQGYRVASFLALGVLLLAVSFAYQNDWLALRNTEAGPDGPLPKESA